MDYEHSLARKNLAKTYISECQDGVRYSLMSQTENKNSVKRLSTLQKRERIY